MTNELKALPTLYRGVTYRSRTEARWAAFFDRMSIDAVYEGEGYDLDVWYLPDFWLPGPGVWFEVKGIGPSQREVEQARRLATASGRCVVIAIGHPTANDEAYNLVFFGLGSDGRRARFADQGKSLIVITGEGFDVLLELEGSQRDLSGAPYPDECLKVAREVQSLRFGVHE